MPRHNSFIFLFCTNFTYYDSRFWKNSRIMVFFYDRFRILCSFYFSRSLVLCSFYLFVFVSNECLRPKIFCQNHVIFIKKTFPVNFTPWIFTFVSDILCSFPIFSTVSLRQCFLLSVLYYLQIQNPYGISMHIYTFICIYIRPFAS